MNVDPKKFITESLKKHPEGLALKETGKVFK